MVQTILNCIGGERMEPRSRQHLDDVEPATGRVYALVPDSDEHDVGQAYDAAHLAFRDWSRTPAAERSRVLLRIADLIDADRDRLAEAESVDTGKPISLARSVDIPRAAANFRFFATAILHAATDAHATDDEALNVTRRSPRGVAGLITPWNLPLYLLTWKVAPAIATGNTVVAKPSEVTPMTAFLLCELCEQAGLPPGVLNVVHGLGSKVGAAIVDHPGIPTISFTGGTATGEEIARTAAPMLKRLALELGGKNPYVIFADADLDEAIDTGVRAAFTNQGQICLCGSRMLIERPVYEELTERLVEGARARRIGDPLDRATEHGALVSRAHLEKVEGAIARAREEGGEILCGGGRPDKLPERCAEGFFLEPTVIAGLGPSCRTNQEEIFGPVVTVQPFDDEDEAVALANDVRYGLAASVWTGDGRRALRMADAIDAGTVWVNCWMLRDLRAPFGGMKASGVGREGGDEALRFFTEPKNVCFKR